MKWSEAIKAIQGFRNLKDDWDGEGTPAPTVTSFATAISMACDFAIGGLIAGPDRVFVGVNGTIIFEWHPPKGRYQEIEIFPNGDRELRFGRENVNPNE